MPAYAGASPRDEVLPESASLLLDVVRFSLAVLVVVGHVSEPPFSYGWPNVIAWANGAVPGFFVLSGFMIRYVTATREREARRYWISRASRIYSVVLPAMLLTVVCDAVSRWINLPFYASVTRPERWAEVPLRLGIHLLFLGQVWGHTTLLLSNRPFWSMGYEVPYYVLFGLLQFLRGWARIATVMAAAAVFGPQILFLLPLWWSGCWLFEVWRWSRPEVAPEAGKPMSQARNMPPLIWEGKLVSQQADSRHTCRQSAWRRWALGGAAALGLMVLLIPVRGGNLLSRMGQMRNPLLLLHQPVGRATVFAYGAGLFFWSVMVLLLVLSDRIALRRGTRFARGVRQVAEGTFALYLFHFPLLVLLGAAGVLRGESVADRWWAVVAITGVCITLAVPVDWLKQWMRRQLTAVLAVPGGTNVRSSNSD